MKKTYLLIVLFLLSIGSAIAQEVEMADTFRSEGKIYVVVLIIGIITTGLFGYLFYLDKKVSGKEKSTNAE